MVLAFMAESARFSLPLGARHRPVASSEAEEAEAQLSKSVQSQSDGRVDGAL